MKKKIFPVNCLLAIGLTLLFVTCKKQGSKFQPGPAAVATDKVDNDVEFIHFKSTKDTAAIMQKYLARVAKKNALGGQAQVLTCEADAWIVSFGVARTGSCAGGYTYSLHLDDIVFLTGTNPPTSPVVTINGNSFSPTFDYQDNIYWHYHLTVSYSSIGLSSSDYCSTTSLDIGYWTCGTQEDETDVFTMDASEGCGRTDPSNTSTATPYSYIPFGLGQSGGANLSVLWSLCSDCRVEFPDTYAFQWRVHGTTTWSTAVWVNFPDYLSYNVSLASGTYDLQGYDVCGSASSYIWVYGPTVSASGTFVVP